MDDPRDRIPRVVQCREAMLRGPISTLMVGIGVAGFGNSPLLDSTEPGEAIFEVDSVRFTRPDVTEAVRIYEVRLHPELV